MPLWSRKPKTVRDITMSLSKILEGMPTDCGSCNLKPICGEVEGMRELHFGYHSRGRQVGPGQGDFRYFRVYPRHRLVRSPAGRLQADAEHQKRHH